MQSFITIDLGAFVREELRHARTLQEGGMLAAAIIKAIPCGVEMVFGPVKNGGIIHDGHPDHRANIRAIEHTIARLEEEDVAERTIFNQLAFKPFIDRQRDIWLGKHKRAPGTYHEPIINDFYMPMFNTEKIEVGHFIHGWKRGRVPKLAHQILLKQGKKLVELPKGFHEQHKQLAA